MEVFGTQADLGTGPEHEAGGMFQGKCSCFPGCQSLWRSVGTVVDVEREGVRTGRVMEEVVARLNAMSISPVVFMRERNASAERPGRTGVVGIETRHVQAVVGIAARAKAG